MIKINKVFLFIRHEDSKSLIIDLKKELEIKHKDIIFEFLEEVDTPHGKRCGITFIYTQDNFLSVVDNIDTEIKDILGVFLIKRR